jgi:hypothetical protein
MPEWGGWLWVRGLNAAECEELSAMITTDNDGWPCRLALESYVVVHCLVDRHGRRLFTNDEVEWVGGKSARAIDRIVCFSQVVASASEDGPLHD